MCVFSKILVIIFIFIILWSNLRIFPTHLLISFDGRFLVLMFDDLFSFSHALDLPCFDLTGFCLEHSVSGTIFLLSSFILFWLKFFFFLVFCSYAGKWYLTKHYDINICFLSDFVYPVVILKLMELRILWDD